MGTEFKLCTNRVMSPAMQVFPLNVPAHANLRQDLLGAYNFGHPLVQLLYGKPLSLMTMLFIRAVRLLTHPAAERAITL